MGPHVARTAAGAREIGPMITHLDNLTVPWRYW
jgi:hypothetical protein